MLYGPLRPGVATADILGPGQGLTFQQVAFDYVGLSPVPYSQYGEVFVNYSALPAGDSSGYINVVLQNGGWAVQNLPVASSSGYPGLGQYFNLGAAANGSPISGLSAFAEFTTNPLSSAPSGSFQTYDSGNGNFAQAVVTNAQGRGADRSVNPGPPSPNGATIFGSGANSLTFQPGHTNVEQDVNQCGPGSVANSFDYLRTRYGVPIPNNQTNTPGIAGNPATSLVAQLDTAMGRAQGQTVSDNNFLNGKLTYLANNKITDLRIDFETGAGGGGTLPAANVQAGGLTAMYDGAVTGKWITGELQAGEDVELGLGFAGGGGHWIDMIGGGTILGVPWVAYIQDANQGFDANTGTTDLNGGTGLFDGGYGFAYLSTDKNGNVTLSGIDGAGGLAGTIDVAVAESVPEPSTLVLTLTGLLSIGACHWWRRGQETKT